MIFYINFVVISDARPLEYVEYCSQRLFSLGVPEHGSNLNWSLILIIIHLYFILVSICVLDIMVLYEILSFVPNDLHLNESMSRTAESCKNTQKPLKRCLTAQIRTGCFPMIVILLPLQTN